jgi:hypothetical protein
MPTPRPAPQVVNNYTALDPDRALSAYGQRQQDAPMNQMPTREEIQMGNPKYSCTSTSIYTSPNNSRKNTSGNAKYASTNCSRFKHAKV